MKVHARTAQDDPQAFGRSRGLLEMGKNGRPGANPPHAELKKSQEDTLRWTEAPGAPEQGPVKGSLLFFTS